MTPSQIASAAACYGCIHDKQAALIYLADAIVANGGGGVGEQEVFSGHYGGGVPTDTPTATAAIAYDLDNGSVWQWSGTQWQ